MNSLYKKMAGSAGWMVWFQLCTKGIGFVSTLILARLLLPADFGLIAIAVSIMAFVDLMGAYGLHVTLIQRADISDEHYNTAWTLQLIVGLLSALLMAVSASLMAEVFAEPRLEAVVQAFALAFLLEAFKNIGVVEFQREMKFQQEFYYLIVPRIIAFVATVSVAFWLRSYWALVAGTLVSRMSGLALSYFIHPYRPKLSLSRIGEFFHMSKWLLVNNALTYVWQYSGPLFLGRLSTTTSVGLFTVANEVSSIPTTHLIAPINKAVFPGYSSIAQDREQLSKAFIDVAHVIAGIILPIGVGIASVALLAVPLLLGDNWLNAIALVQVLAVAGAIKALLTNAASIYLALGKPQVITAYVGFKTALLVALFLALCGTYGAMGAAWSVLISECIMFPIGVILIGRYIDVPIGRYLAAIYRPVFACLTMAAVVKLITSGSAAGMTDTANLLIGLARGVFAGAVTYTITVLLLWLAAGRPDGMEQIAFNKVRGFFGKREAVE